MSVYAINDINQIEVIDYFIYLKVNVFIWGDNLVFIDKQKIVSHIIINADSHILNSTFSISMRRS